MDLDYSVIIRTTGKAGEKYRKLLNAVAALEPKPREIIVVLPEGYDLPAERLGWESFCFCSRGMVIQRMTGIRKCKTPYALICDDDVCFGPDFVQKLHAPLVQGLGGLSIAPLYSFLPQHGVRGLVDAVLGSGAPALLRRHRYVSVLRTTGYSYNRRLDPSKKYCETQSAPWTCFYADVDALRSIDFEAEQSWLDSNGYSALDDQTMFYKAWLRGIKTIVVTDAAYEHLDAGTSTRGNRDQVLFSRSFNRVVFWHRFIFSLEKNVIGKTWARICYAYYWNVNRAFDLLRRVPRHEQDVKADGRQEAWKYLRSDAYRSLPPVKE